MRHSKDDIDDIVSIGRAASIESLLHKFNQLSSRHGGTELAIGLFGGPADISLHHATPGNDAWRVASIQTGLINHCPSIIHTWSASHAATIEELQAAPTASRGAEAVRVARDCGIKHGLVVPVHTSSGEKGGVAIQTGDALARHAVSTLSAAAIVLHGRYEALCGRTETAVELTDREIDVLAWMAEGKQAEDVAVLLGISTSTVMFHSRQAQAKLGTSNRTHTVAEAIRRGLLF